MGKNCLDASDSGLEISEIMLEQYLESLSAKGKSKGTIQTYRHNLFRLCRSLSDDKKIYRGTLENIRKDMLTKGYSASTVNSFTASVNGFLEFCGRRDYQVFETLKCEKDAQPELTRAEYLRLLSAARMLGRERVYLLIKVIASTGVMLSQLPEITVEAARAGEIYFPGNVVHIPSVLCRELLDYADRHSLRAGPIFVTRTGHEIDRSNLNREIRNLARDARVLPEKCTPLSLRRLYQTTQQGMQSQVEILVKRAGDRLMEREQYGYGWQQPEPEKSGYDRKQTG
ncbi:MAG: site-specific integrase [Clostridiales bacterium]|nr:site-specific integrase [Clostridiales bacterium]